MFLTRELDMFKEEMRTGLRDLHDSVHIVQDKMAEASQSHNNHVLQEVKAAIAELSTGSDRKPEAILGPELLRVAQAVGDMRLSMGEELQRLARVCGGSADHYAGMVSALDVILAKILEVIATQKEGSSHACVEGCDQKVRSNQSYITRGLQSNSWIKSLRLNVGTQALPSLCSNSRMRMGDIWLRCVQYVIYWLLVAAHVECRSVDGRFRQV
jgi:hypothetical protein